MTNSSPSTAPSEEIETEAAHLLEETTASVQDRISRLESLLDGEEALEDALATFAKAGEQHVLIGEGRRLAHLERYCQRLPESYDITLTRILAHTLDNGVSTNSLRAAIESADHLCTEQIDHRLSLLSSIEQLSSSHTVDQSQQGASDPKLSERHSTEPQDGTPTEATAETTGHFSREQARSRDADRDRPPNKTARDNVSSPTDQSSEDNTLRSGEQSTNDDKATNEQSGSPQSDRLSQSSVTDSSSVDSTVSTAQSEQSDEGADTLSQSATLSETETVSDQGCQQTSTSSFGSMESDDTGVSQAPDDRHRGTIDPPQRRDPTESGSLSISNYAQDLVSFDFVLDSNEEFVPDDVRAGGLIKLDDKQYAGITRVHPRTWSIHTNEKKAEIVGAYKSSFLATLDFPIQIVSYPTHFDISDHLERLQSVRNLSEDDYGESGLADMGRSLYPEWLTQFLSDNDMKQREFYIIAPISADQIDQFRSDDDGFLDSLADSFPPAEPVADFFGDDSESISTHQILRELDSRLNRISSGLQRFDVQSERLTDRNEAMAVLYHYYNNEKPLTDEFSKGMQIDTEPFNLDSSNVRDDDT